MVQVGGGGWFACGKMREGDRQRNRQVNAPAFLKTNLEQNFPFSSPRSIPIENINPGLTCSIPIQTYNLDTEFEPRCFYLQGPPGVQKRLRSKKSIHNRPLEILNLEGSDRICSIAGAGAWFGDLLMVMCRCAHACDPDGLLENRFRALSPK